MKTFFLRWISNTLALVAVALVLRRGIWFRNWHSYITAALVLGLLNAFVRPVLLFLTLPLNIITLGLFTILLNAAIFFSTGYIIQGFMIRNYTWAIAGSLLFSAFSTILSWIFHERPEIRGGFHLWRY
ncbi:MAG TPA: phage holin family protein [Elusimicrobiota bacterium]|nr:phage holin family protein [Elusimicrobiota bacterium]